MENKTKLPLIYIIGLPIIVLVANALANIKFTILGSYLSVSAFLYPLSFFITCLIIKKTNYKNALRIMIFALAAEALAAVVEWIVLKEMDSYVMIYGYLSLLICQLILIYTYDFLVKKKKDTFIFVFLLLLVVSAIDNAFFGAIIEGQYISFSSLVRLIYAIVLACILTKKTQKVKLDKKEKKTEAQQ